MGIRGLMIACALVACGKKDDSKAGAGKVVQTGHVTVAGKSLAVPVGFVTAAEIDDKDLVASLQKVLGADATILVSTKPLGGSVIGLKMSSGPVGTTEAACNNVTAGLTSQVGSPVTAEVFASPKPAGCVFHFRRPSLAPELLYYLAAPSDQHVVIECIGAAGEDQVARDVECANFAHELATP